MGDDSKIMLNPSEGYDFDPATASPLEPPVCPELAQVDKIIKVGMLMTASSPPSTRSGRRETEKIDHAATRQFTSLDDS